MALEYQVTLADIHSRNKSLVDKLASIEEEIKKQRPEAKVAGAKKIEDAAKLDFDLAKIEALKKEVQES